jgi:hypothetical protein
MGHDPYISRGLEPATDAQLGLGQAATPRVWGSQTVAVGEPRAVIEAIQRLNEAIHLARKAGWVIAPTVHPQEPDEASNGPHREVRATIHREV